MENKIEIIKKILLRRRHLAASTILEGTALDTKKLFVMKVMLLNELQRLCNVKKHMELKPTNPLTIENGSSFVQYFKNIERKVEEMLKVLDITMQQLIQLEEEKSEILKMYADREAEIQKALVDMVIQT